MFAFMSLECYSLPTISTQLRFVVYAEYEYATLTMGINYLVVRLMRSTS